MYTLPCLAPVPKLKPVSRNNQKGHSPHSPQLIPGQRTSLQRMGGYLHMTAYIGKRGLKSSRRINRMEVQPNISTSQL